MYDDEQVEHECPRPLRQRVDVFYAGDMFISPASRWERVTSATQTPGSTYLMTICTDKTGPDYGWVLSPSNEFPHVSSYDLGRAAYVVVSDVRRFGKLIEAWVGPNVDWAGPDCHVLASASPAPGAGSGWNVVDRPAGGELREQNVPSKAAARSLVRRLAREHAKRLGVPLWRPERAS